MYLGCVCVSSFHPDSSLVTRQAFRQLRDMGFEEAAVLAALQVTRNQSTEAVGRLLASKHATEHPM